MQPQFDRTTATGQVLQDYLSISPGERWRERIFEALEALQHIDFSGLTHGGLDEFEPGTYRRNDVTARRRAIADAIVDRASR